MIKCYHCWRVYTEVDLSHKDFSGCKCTSRKFMKRPDSLFNKILLILGRII